MDAYLSPDVRDARLHAWAAQAGGEVVVYGESAEGRALLAARVPSSQPAAPRVMVAANIHGVEFVGGMVALQVLHALAEKDEQWAQLRARAEIWVFPCLNPDGYARTWRQGGCGTVKALRTNARGVDLNRNFPLPAGRRRAALPFTGSADPAAATYCGLHPLSEPETAALCALWEQQKFSASVNLHSTMGTLIPARCTDRADYRTYKSLCAAFQSAQPRWRYRRLAHRIFDAYTGEMEDFQHHRFGVWAVCVEVFPIFESLKAHLRAPSTFARFNPSDPHPFLQNDLPGILAFLLAAIEQGPPRAPLG